MRVIKATITEQNMAYLIEVEPEPGSKEIRAAGYADKAFEVARNLVRSCLAGSDDALEPTDAEVEELIKWQRKTQLNGSVKWEGEVTS